MLAQEGRALVARVHHLSRAFGAGAHLHALVGRYANAPTVLGVERHEAVHHRAVGARHPLEHDRFAAEELLGRCGCDGRPHERARQFEGAAAAIAPGGPTVGPVRSLAARVLAHEGGALVSRVEYLARAHWALADGLALWQRRPEGAGELLAHDAAHELHHLGHEGAGLGLVAGDCGEVALHARGEVDASELRDHLVDECAALGGRGEGRAFAGQVAAVHERGDDARACGGGADAARVQRGVLDGCLELVFLHEVVGVLHRGEQGGVGVAPGRARLRGLHLAAQHGARAGRLQVGGDARARGVVLARCALAALTRAGDVLPGRGCLLAGTQQLPAAIDVGGGGGRVGQAVAGGAHRRAHILAVWRHGGQQRLAQKARHRGLLLGERRKPGGRELAGGEERPVALHLAVVHHLGDVVGHRMEGLRHGLAHVALVGHEAHEPLEGGAVLGVHVLGVGARVGGEFLLVECLQGAVHGVGRHAEPLACELLHAGGVEQGGGTLAAAFALHGDDGAGRALGLLEHLPGLRLRAARLSGDEEALSQVEAHAEGLRAFERLDGAVALHHHGQGGGAHAPHALRRAHGGRVEAARVHAHEPVGLGARHGRLVQACVLGVGPHAPEGLLEGGVFQRGAPQALHRQAAPHEVERQVGDALALAVGVARVDHARIAPAAHKLGHGCELGVCAALLRDGPAPLGVFGDDGQRRRALGAPLGAVGVLVGHEEA